MLIAVNIKRDRARGTEAPKLEVSARQLTAAGLSGGTVWVRELPDGVLLAARAPGRRAAVRRTGGNSGVLLAGAWLARFGFAPGGAADLQPTADGLRLIACTADRSAA